jgi:hypothetical protein
MTVLERLKKLDEERAKLLAGAKAEGLKKAEEAVADLNSLGFSYRLVKGNSGGKKGKGTRNTDPSKRHCSICEVDGHDARAHRGQGKNKKKFTPAELKELTSS